MDLKEAEVREKEKSITIEPKALRATYKSANEYGIAGFVFASILGTNSGLLSFHVSPQMFNSMDNMEAYLGLIISFVLIIISAILSLIGCSKKSEQYQMGLAYWGMFFNIILIVFWASTFYNGYNN